VDSLIRQPASGSANAVRGGSPRPGSVVAHRNSGARSGWTPGLFAVFHAIAWRTWPAQQPSAIVIVVDAESSKEFRCGVHLLHCPRANGARNRRLSVHPHCARSTAADNRKTARSPSGSSPANFLPGTGGDMTRGAVPPSREKASAKLPVAWPAGQAVVWLVEPSRAEAASRFERFGRCSVRRTAGRSDRRARTGLSWLRSPTRHSYCLVYT
jgi:hypothetical protein